MADRRSSLFAPSRADLASRSQVDHSDAPSESRRKRPHTPLLNTYKMTPDKPWDNKAVLAVINAVLKDQLEEEKYDARSTKQMAKTLSAIITNRVKALDFPRFKIVTIVTVGEVDEASLRVASRCLMSQPTDNFVSGSFKNASLFGVAEVYGMYYE